MRVHIHRFLTLEKFLRFNLFLILNLAGKDALLLIATFVQKLDRE